MESQGEKKPRRGRFRFRRMRSRIRVLFILAGYLAQWATPWTLVGGGAVLLLARCLQVWAYGHLDKASRTSRHRPEAITSSGPYAFVRNPIMYGSGFSDLGFLAMTGNPILIGLYCAAMGPVHVLRVLRLEEPFLQERYGEAFRRYRSAVPRFLPRLLPYPERDRRCFRPSLVLGNRELSRTFNYLFLGSLLIPWSLFGTDPYLPSWEGLGHAISRPWVLALSGSLGCLALVASYLQIQAARSGRDSGSGSEEERTTPGSPASG